MLGIKSHTVPFKCKLTVSRSSILETRFSRLESSFETFEAVREFIETVREFIESSFETFEWGKQRTFRAINFGHVWIFIAAAASEPEVNERGSSLISRRLHYRGLQSLFLTKPKEFWLCANGSFRMCSGMRERKHFRMRSDMVQGTVVMRQWMI